MCKENGTSKKKDVDKNKERDIMDTAVRYCPVSESLEDSVKEMKSIREGKLSKKTWQDLLIQLQKEDEKGR